MSHKREAKRWLLEADERQLPEAGLECLATAQVHAILAVADAVDGLAMAVAEQTRRMVENA